MQNGHDKQPQTISVNPQQAAAFAMQFLEAVAHTRAQREAYDMAVGMLQAIASGQVILAPPVTLESPPQPKVDER
jgi:phage gp36-like protein